MWSKRWRKKKKLPKISNLKSVDWNKIDVLFCSLPTGQSQILAKKLIKKAKERKLKEDAPKNEFESKLSMIWDQESKDMIASTPPGIIEMAINNVEDFARENEIEEITKSVVLEQMKSVGMDPSMLS